VKFNVAIQLFNSNHKKSDFFLIFLKLISRPRRAYETIQLLLKKEYPLARRSISWILDSKSGPNFSAETIEGDIKRWLKMNATVKDQVTFTILIPVFEPNLSYLADLIENVLHQTYGNWELILVADGLPSANKLLDSEKIKNLITNIVTEETAISERTFAAKRFELLILSQNIGVCAATKKAMERSLGQYLVLVDQDDLISLNSLEVFSQISTSNFDVAYSDHCIIGADGEIREIFKKPDWSPILATQMMYFGHLKCFKKEIALKYYKSNFGSFVEDHMATLKAGLDNQKIVHLPLILASWRMSEKSIARTFWNKPTVAQQFQKEVNILLRERSVPLQARITKVANNFQSLIPSESLKDSSIQIVIPTMWKSGAVLDLLPVLLDSSFVNLSVILIDTLRTKRPQSFNSLVSKYTNNLSIIEWNTHFNYSKVNNYAASLTKSEFLLFLNDDVLPLCDDWIDYMISLAKFPKVGAVGARLIYPNGRIQHGGITLGLRGTADHTHRHESASMELISREVSAATGACLLVRQNIFEMVRGFDENYNIAYQDVDLCLNIAKAGFSTVQSQNSTLLHHESLSRGDEYDLKDRNRFIQKWMRDFDRDPFSLSISI
jgi:glycosyltransferase involved in cell wall biosynthesis